MSRPYHRFVFDADRRRFVGAFEDMYRGEDAEGYDSWDQEDMDTVSRRLSLAVLAGRDFGTVLDVGCGKGAFTSHLKRPGNHVVGIDVSDTAIAKARARYPEIEFRRLAADELSELPARRFDLVVAMEILSYLEDWRGALERMAEIGERLYLTLYLPPDPIGFVKSFADLRSEVARHYETETELLLDGRQLMVLARSRRAPA